MNQFIQWQVYIETRMDQFMELMQKWKDNTEARMDAYDQFFRHQGAEQKTQQSIAKLTRENQHTLDVADVDLHEKDREGEVEEEGEYPLTVGGAKHDDLYRHESD